MQVNIPYMDPKGYMYIYIYIYMLTHTPPGAIHEVFFCLMKRSVESSKMLQWENFKWLSVQTFRLVYMYVYAGSHHDQQSSRDLMSSLAVANIIF